MILPFLPVIDDDGSLTLTVKVAGAKYGMESPN
jgi:hypothetical protein